jgi:hypothetical protein
VQQRNSKKTYETKVSSTQKKNAKRNDEEKTAKIHFFSCSKQLPVTAAA